MQLNLHRLWIFLQVVEAGGFSAAAQKLYMSQPSVSNQVRQLESSLKATLVDRSGSRIRATAEGEVLVEYAKRIFRLADDAASAIAAVQGLQSGRLVVGGTTTVGTYLLPPTLARFRQQFPEVECDLYVGNATQMERWVLDGDVGLGVFVGTPTAPQLVTADVLTDDSVLVVAPGHELAGERITPERLLGQRFLLRERGSSTRELQEKVLADWHLGDVSTVDMGMPETLKQAVRADLGVTVVSKHTVAEELRDGRLAEVVVDPAPQGRPVVVAHRRDRLLSPAEQAFVSVVRTLATWPDEGVST
ncbi:LysR family transcriptional regulator [Kribbella sp. NPDC054772]